MDSSPVVVDVVAPVAKEEEKKTIFQTLVESLTNKQNLSIQVVVDTNHEANEFMRQLREQIAHERLEHRIIVGTPGTILMRYPLIEESTTDALFQKHFNRIMVWPIQSRTFRIYPSNVLIIPNQFCKGTVCNLKRAMVSNDMNWMQTEVYSHAADRMDVVKTPTGKQQLFNSNESTPPSCCF